jgi:hypothetical protein
LQTKLELVILITQLDWVWEVQAVGGGDDRVVESISRPFDWIRFMQTQHIPHSARPRAVTISVFILAASILLSGCGQDIPGLVPVSGKLTYDGGKWPKKGEIIFSPVQKVGSHPLLPAMGHIEEDGTFIVLSSESKGMVPGEYNAAIRCMLDAPAEHDARRNASPEEGRGGKSAIPDRYASPTTSGLTVSVPEGSAPIYLKWDIQSN